MSWIESHQEILSHPKTLRLCRTLGLSLNETLGILHRLWWWCVDHAEDGDLRRFSDGDLALAVGLNCKDGRKFVKALVEACWLDREPYFRVHDWWDYIGRFLQVRYKAQPHKWQRVRDLYSPSINNPPNNRCNNPPNNRPPNLTEQNHPPPSSPPPKKGGEECAGKNSKQKKHNKEFEQFWQAYPKKKSKGQAERAWKKLNPDLFPVIFSTLEKAKNSWDWKKDKGQYIPYPATWLNAKGWEDEYAPSLTSACHPPIPRPKPILSPEEQARAHEARAKCIAKAKDIFKNLNLQQKKEKPPTPEGL